MSNTQTRSEDGERGVTAVYCRVSKKSGNSRESGDSLANQAELAMRWIGQDAGLRGGEIRYFQDDGYTGTNMKRPAVQKALAGIFCGKIQALVVKDFSRLSRNHLQLSELLELILPGYPVRVISIADGYDSARSTYNMDSAIKNLFYEYYCRDISHKTREALYGKSREGIYAAGRVPYGYRRDRQGRLEIVEEEALLVRKIYELSCQGESCPSIAAYMNQSGGGGTNRRVWQAAAVWRILHDPVYAGNDVWHRYENRYRDGFITEAVPRSGWYLQKNKRLAVISPEIYMENKRRHPFPAADGHKKRPRHIFHGLTKCGWCGRALCRAEKESDLLICKTDRQKNKISCDRLLQICKRVFTRRLEMENLEMNEEIFLRIFISKIVVKGSEIRICAKVTVANT